MVADVKCNIIGADFLSYLSISVNFEKNCFEFSNKSILYVFQKDSKIEYPALFIFSSKFSELLLKFPEITQSHDKLSKIKHKITHKITHKIIFKRQLSEKLKCVRREIEEMLAVVYLVFKFTISFSVPHVPKTSAHGNTFRLCGDYH